MEKKIDLENINHSKEIILNKEKTGKWTFLYIGGNPTERARDTGTDIIEGIVTEILLKIFQL